MAREDGNSDDGTPTPNGALQAQLAKINPHLRRTSSEPPPAPTTQTDVSSFTPPPTSDNFGATVEHRTSAGTVRVETSKEQQSQFIENVLQLQRAYIRKERVAMFHSFCVGLLSLAGSAAVCYGLYQSTRSPGSSKH